MPSTLPIIVIVAAFVAGPAINKTNAAPGLIPFNIKIAAKGIEPVAQIYIGIDTAKIKSICMIGDRSKSTKKSSGIIDEIIAAKTNPMTNHFEISCINSTKPYLNTSITR